MAPTEQQLKQSKAQQLAGLKKAPKARVQRYLKKHAEPLVKEPGKSSLLFQGISCSANMMLVLKELKSLQAPLSKLLTKKNNIIPFDTVTGAGGEQSVEFLCTKNDCSLFGIATHNKKRPNNLVIGRMFNHQILDRVELGITYFKSMKDYGGTIPKKRIGSKPLLLFVGDIWTQIPQYTKLQNLLIDFYRGDVVDKLIATGIDHIITFNGVSNTTSNNDSIIIHQRTYFIQLKKGTEMTTNSNKMIPQPHLIPCGPDFDYVVRRTAWADPTLAKEARKQPTISKSKHATTTSSSRKVEKKNMSTNIFGETLGKLHIPKQTLTGQQTGRKMKSLRRAEKIEIDNERNAIEQELQQEANNNEMEE